MNTPPSRTRINSPQSTRCRALVRKAAALIAAKHGLAPLTANGYVRQRAKVWKIGLTKAAERIIANYESGWD